MISGLTTRFKAIEELDKTFGFLWKYRDIADNAQIIAACRRFASRYRNDVSEDRLAEEVMHLKVIHDANFGAKSLAPFDLLNEIARFKLEEIFGNVCIALRIFCSIPATVASAERSFSKLSLIKNFQRSTMTQGRLNDLAILSIESELARSINFSECINTFFCKEG